MSEEPLLHGEFGAHPAAGGARYALSLTRTELHVQRLAPRPEAEPRAVLRLADVVGCHTLRSRAPALAAAAFFAVYAYPPRPRPRGPRPGPRGRQRAARTFRVDQAPRYEDNRRLADKWARAIKCLVLGVALSADAEAPAVLPRPRRLLLLLNPFGGRGRALQWCQSHVLPMMAEAGISFNLVQTERANHARELVTGISLAEWDGIVTLSGDGLLFEVVNGLMERRDWAAALRMPLGILPCGSGNALAGAVNFHAGLPPALGVELLQNCAVLLCHGALSPLDLVSVTTASGARCFSFLSVAWGFVSDVDIESEKYRHMGAARFTLGTAVRLAALHTYRGRLSYLPAPEPPPGPPPRRPVARSVTAPGPLPPPPAPLPRAVSDLGLCPEPEPEAPRSLPGTPEEPPPGDLEALAEAPGEAPWPGDAAGTPGDAPPPGDAPGGPVDDLLVPLGQPVPPSWVTLEGDFVLVLALYQTHLGAELLAAPRARFDEGVIHLCYVRAGVSRAALARLLLAMARGAPWGRGCPQLGRVPARAFRLEPLTPRGVLTVDGERVEYGPLQAQIHRGLARLLTGAHPRPPATP
ncbi:sphingosine kinase 2-like [Apteryx mantelli]|uniref:Sphingosine kinase 2-like n=1 Tax=Apteryx mantelli TaxID=2696672 RepID=A0ABM4FZR3_9AVES